ncbi:MAG: dicarboxylate/amino acid:cation symporter [Treponema sp.]|nr:dicarboxylate/amino acid:cation symporter [Treponema sp.]MCL2252317.1 dicarboxylate/amino acid:cation symporter [Treponema sp.]
MKVWIKLLIGSILGMVIGFLLPNTESVISSLIWLEKLAIGIGRYAVIPVLVFSLTIAVYELRMDEQFWSIILKNMLLIIAASCFVIFSGIIITSIFSPGRIPIETVEQIEVLGINITENVHDLFPSNMFSVLAGSGSYLFPVCIFAFFLGLGLNYDRNYSKPIISQIDALSRIFYHIASFFTEILGFVLIVLAAFWAVRFNSVLQAKVFKDLILLLGIFSVILCFVILPLSLYFLKPRINPWRVLYGLLGPAFAAFFSGDVNFSIPVLSRHTKENFGIRRRSSAISLALFSTFCRCGSAMVAAAAFIVIIKSYSYLRIAPADLFLIGLHALLISFLLARHPGEGAYIALAALCLAYGGGEYRAGYLILKPLAFYLIAVGTFIDIMLNAFGTYVLARMNGFIEEKNLVHYI